MSSYHIKNQSSMAPAHTHTHTHTEREKRESAKKVGPTLLPPRPAVVFSSFLPGVSLTKGSPRLVGENKQMFCSRTPERKKKFPSRDKETVVKKGVV